MRPFFNAIERIFVATSTAIGTAAAAMDDGALGICLVVDDGRRLLTTITDGDLRRAMLAGIGFDRPVADLVAMKASAVPITAPIEADDGALLAVMTERQIRHIPLLDSQGAVRDIALLTALAEKPAPHALQAVVMAGGFGKRLRPFTQSTPKPMLPVGDKPLLEHTIGQLRQAGVAEVNIATHYLHDQIADHFGSGEGFGVHVNYLREETPLGTAGALGMMDEPKTTTLVMNGDILTTIDIGAMAEFHRGHKAALTVAVRLYEVKVPYGVVESDGISVKALKEKPEFRFFVNAGIYLIEPLVWSYIPKGEYLDMPTLIERLIAEGLGVTNFPIREYWLDIGRPEDYQRAQDDVGNKLAPKEG